MQQSTNDSDGDEPLIANSQGRGGYKKPPLYGRFKKRRSGNKKGRPLGRQNLAKIAAKVFETRILIKIGDEMVKLPLLEALVRVHMTKALRGDAKSQRAFALLMDELGFFDDKIDEEQQHGVLLFRGLRPQNEEEWLFFVHRSEQLRRERPDETAEAKQLVSGAVSTQIH